MGRCWRGLAAVVLAVGLGGCCWERPPERGPLPGPISLEEQVGRLNARAQVLSTLKATGRVKIDYVEDGKKHHEEADGVLMLRQVSDVGPFETESQADIALFGRFAGSDVFELGENREWYWMAIRLDPKRAYVGKVVGAPPSDAQGGGMPFRAGRVLPLLAITKLPQELFADNIGTFMLVDDEAGVNRLLLERCRVIERELIVDRRSGDVVEVRLYKASGVVEAVAKLSEYKVLDEAGATVRMPRKIVIEYPGREAKVELDLSSVRLSSKLLGPAGEAAFALPDFKDQGLQVIDVDRK